MPDASDASRQPNRAAARRARLAYLTVSALSDMEPEVVVVPDAETAEVSVGAGFLPADLVVQHLDLRLRLILLPDSKDPASLHEPDALRAAELLLRHWPETAAVGLVANDAVLSCLVLEPFDVESSIGTPSGLPLPPTPRRTPLPVQDAIQAYLELVAPSWDRVPLAGELPAIGYQDVASAIARQIRSKIIGRRANIDEKRAALDSLDEADARWATRMVLEASAKGLDGPTLARELEKRVARRE